MIAGSKFPFQRIENGSDFGFIFGVFEPINQNPQNGKETLFGLILQVKSLALGVVEVVAQLVLVASQGGAKPVEGVIKLLQWHLKLYEFSNEPEPNCSLAGVNIDFLDLFLYFARFDGCLE